MIIVTLLNMLIIIIIFFTYEILHYSYNKKMKWFIFITKVKNLRMNFKDTFLSNSKNCKNLYLIFKVIYSNMNFFKGIK